MPEVETSNVIHSELKSARIEKSKCAVNETPACWIEISTFVQDELTDSRIEPSTLVQNARERIENSNVVRNEPTNETVENPKDEPTDEIIEGIGNIIFVQERNDG